MKIRVISKSKYEMPGYATYYSAGMDIRANLESEIVLKPFERTVLKTGSYPEIPVDFEVQVRPGSGGTINNGVIVLNSPDKINADYRGEVCIIRINLAGKNFVISDGERISQMIIAKQQKADWMKLDSLIVT